MDALGTIPKAAAMSSRFARGKTHLPVRNFIPGMRPEYSADLIC